MGVKVGYSCQGKFNRKKIKVNMSVPIELSLGDANSGLDLNQYLLVDTDGLLFSSDMQHDFCRQKNKIFFGSDGSGDEITSIISNLITSNSDASFDYIDIVSSSVTATVNNGTANQIAASMELLNLRCTFIMKTKTRMSSLIRALLTLTGSGVPAP